MAHDQCYWKSTPGNNFEIGKFYDGNEGTECEKLKPVAADYSIVSTNALDLFSLNNNSKMDFHAGKLRHSSKASSCLEKYAYTPSESCLFFRYVRIRTPHRRIEKERGQSCSHCSHSTHNCGRSHPSHIASRVLCGVEFVVVFSGPNVTSEKQVKLLKKFAGFIASLNRDESEFELTALEYNQWDYYGDSPCPWPLDNSRKPSLQDIYQFCCKLANLDDEKFESLLNEPKNQKFVYLVPAQKQLALPYEVSKRFNFKNSGVL